MSCTKASSSATHHTERRHRHSAVSAVCVSSHIRDKESMKRDSSIITYPGNEALASALAAHGGEVVEVEVRAFPDGESYVRILDDIQDRVVTIACTLHQPDSVFLRLAMMAHTARDLGAARVELVAPYLPYMRQDERFHVGEGVTSIYFAQMLSELFDALVTVDPHLHRWECLEDLYSLDPTVVSAASSAAEWVREHVDTPLIVGPDAESEQWAQALADHLDCPYVIFEKVRRGDREVDVTSRDLEGVEGRDPVILDDIISTGRTMAQTVRLLRERGMRAPVCLGVHAVFSDDAERLLIEAGAREVLTCNTIDHPTNRIDLCDEIAQVWAALTV